MLTTVDYLWGRREWRECLRLAAAAKARGVLGYDGDVSFDPFDVRHVVAASEGECYGDPWIVAVKLADGRFAFLSVKCDQTIGNGCDDWAGADCLVDVQVAADWPSLFRFGLGDEDRSRLAGQIAQLT